ncbi:MAG: ABC transporter substrate-binding protein [Bacteroidales bacterium]|nr:ABC transporter substrate-binding protein [Bacteroidales bacterium]
MIQAVFRWGLAVAFLLSVTELSAQPFVFTPQWTAQAQFAGYYVAQEMGFYAEEGVEVCIDHPSASRSAIDRIRSGEADATTLQLAQALEIVDNGIPLVNILQTSMNNAMVIVSRRGCNPLEQRGARVGIWNTGFGQLAICMSKKEHLDYEWVRFVSNVNLFVAGALDATLAMSYNEYYQLVQTGMELSESNIYRFSDHGYNVQEDGVYMTRKSFAKDRERAVRFARASRRGWEWAAEHPDETLDIVMKYVEADHIATNRVLQKLMLDDVLRLQLDRDSGERAFRLRPDMVQKANDLMLEYGMLRKEVKYEDLLPR